MDPVTVIVSALATGAAAGLKSTATDAIKDAYSGLKELIKNRYHAASVDALETKPESKSKRDSVTEDLADTKANEDAEVIELARKVLALVKDQVPEVGPEIGVDLSGIEVGGDATIEDIASKHSGVKGEHLRVTGNLNIKGVRAGVREEPEKKS